MTKPKLLIVEDDEAIRTQLKYALRDEYALALAGERTQALDLLRDFGPEVVSLDLGLPPSPDTAEEGLRALDEILKLVPSTKVVVVTGNDDRVNAVGAVQRGAFDYLQKPVDLDQYRVVLRRAIHLRELEREGDASVQSQEESIRFEEILGTTTAIREIFRIIQRVAKADATVLIQGESGTGKELIARAVHQRSRRRHGPFVTINCGAIPETLLESELFGHERGAFTGAHIQRRGKFELAQGGTLFLDEIGELSLMLQVKLLRFLQDRTIERIGGRETVSLDVRVIAATNRDLKAELQRGGFREDLFYRLSVVTVAVPPLRERGEDVLLLANAFLRRAVRDRKRKLRFGGAALEAMMAHHWPGNIRELENRVSRAVIMARGRLIEPADMELMPVEGEGAQAAVSLREARKRAEREALVAALTRHRGNISQAAIALAVSRPTIHELVDKHGVDPRTFRSG